MRIAAPYMAGYTKLCGWQNQANQLLVIQFKLVFRDKLVHGSQQRETHLALCSPEL